MNELAVVDNDFIIHLSETEFKEKSVSDVVSCLFDEMQVDPIMHSLVYQHELNCDGVPDSAKNTALKLFEQKIIEIYHLTEIEKDEDKKSYYQAVFEEAYFGIHGKKVLFDIFKDWKAGTSLGETHSLALCAVIECGIFLSDDSDSVKISEYLRNKLAFETKIYNRKKACERAREIGQGKLDKCTRRAIAHKN